MEPCGPFDQADTKDTVPLSLGNLLLFVFALDLGPETRSWIRSEEAEQRGRLH